MWANSKGLEAVKSNENDRNDAEATATLYQQAGLGCVERLNLGLPSAEQRRAAGGST
jgi:hypothetical protein